ncbi:hypothetical protein LSM04_006782 [Trypanosoma melophagium]|uniref:uncharacterized protein n=1 Tax=Trypanosoma melophagium TaxID=715481 RepID=UPI00351A8377|nr:hypothetical protein LSM04_006782 [Trypanosoma melophagium]
MMKTVLPLGVFLLGHRFDISFLTTLFLLYVSYMSLGVFADSDEPVSATPATDMTLPPLLEGLVSSVISVIAGASIPKLNVSLGGSMAPQNSSWMQLNNWIIIVSVILGVLLLVTMAVTVYFVRRHLRQANKSDEDQYVTSSSESYESDEEEMSSL